MDRRGELVRSEAKPLAPIPEAEPREVFARYKRTWALAGVGMQSVLFTALCLSGLVCLLSPSVGLAALCASTAGLVIGGNRAFLIGNRRLEERLRASLGAEGEFVGVARLESNQLRPRLLFRVETDDNVGFLTLDDERMRIVMESSSLEVKPESIRRVALERTIGMPLVWFIRLELEESPFAPGFLIMSRQASTVRIQRRAIRRLYEAIRDWHFESHSKILDELEAAKWRELEDGSRNPP
ncbi:MAG: hypothetical protein HY791_35750 [Deltaproteobacteria bacterium]|nr:hypothetical protein [Deltaproteobacteria bacterium]